MQNTVLDNLFDIERKLKFNWINFSRQVFQKIELLRRPAMLRRSLYNASCANEALKI